jgi:hypothetical protein
VREAATRQSTSRTQLQHALSRQIPGLQTGNAASIFHEQITMRATISGQGGVDPNGDIEVNQ